MLRLKDLEAIRDSKGRFTGKYKGKIDWHHYERIYLPLITSIIIGALLLMISND